MRIGPASAIRPASTWSRDARSLAASAYETRGATLRLARRRPDVDLPLSGMAIDLLELVRVEVEPLERRDVVLELPFARHADQRRGDSRVPQNPGERELRERLSPPPRNLAQRAHS